MTRTWAAARRTATRWGWGWGWGWGSGWGWGWGEGWGEGVPTRPLPAPQIEKELTDICASILALLDDCLIPTASSGESKVFYLKMKVRLGGGGGWRWGNPRP